MGKLTVLFPNFPFVESTFSISRGHLRSAEHVSCKKQLNKDLCEIKQARTLVKKRIPGSRGEQLIQALARGGFRREGSQNKKRSRPRLSSPSMEDKKAHTRSRSSFPLVSGRLR